MDGAPGGPRAVPRANVDATLAADHLRQPDKRQTSSLTSEATCRVLHDPQFPRALRDRFSFFRSLRSPYYD